MNSRGGAGIRRIFVDVVYVLDAFSVKKSILIAGIPDAKMNRLFEKVFDSFYLVELLSGTAWGLHDLANFDREFRTTLFVRVDNQKPIVFGLFHGKCTLIFKTIPFAADDANSVCPSGLRISADIGRSI